MSYKKMLLGGVAGFVLAPMLFTALNTVGLASTRAQYSRLSPDGQVLEQVRVLERGEQAFDYNEYIQSRVHEEQSKVNAYVDESEAVYSNETYQQHQQVEPTFLDPDLELYATLETNLNQPAPAAEAEGPAEAEKPAEEQTPAPAVEPDAPAVEAPAPTVETPVAQPETPAPAPQTVSQTPAAPQTAPTVIDAAQALGRPIEVNNGARIQIERNEQGAAIIRIEGPLPAGAVLILNNVTTTPEQAVTRAAAAVERNAATTQVRQAVAQVQQEVQTQPTAPADEMPAAETPAPAIEPETPAPQADIPVNQPTPQTDAPAPVTQPDAPAVQTQNNPVFESDILKNMWEGIQFGAQVGYNLGERVVHQASELSKDIGLQQRTPVEQLVQQIKDDQKRMDNINSMMGWGETHRMGFYADGTYEGFDLTPLDKTETFVAEKSKAAARSAVELGQDIKDGTIKAAAYVADTFTTDEKTAPNPTLAEQIAETQPSAEPAQEAGFIDTVGDTLQTAAQKTGDAIEKAYDGSWLETGVQKVAGVFTGTKQTEQTTTQPAEQTVSTPTTETPAPAEQTEEPGFMAKMGASINNLYADSWLQHGVDGTMNLFSSKEKAAPTEQTPVPEQTAQTAEETPAPTETQAEPVITVQNQAEDTGFFTTVGNTWDDLYKNSWAEKSVDWTADAYKGSWLETGVDKTVEAGKFVGELGMNIGQETVRLGDETLKDVGLKERTPTEQLVQQIKDQQKQLDDINQTMGMNPSDTAPKFAMYADGTYEGVDVTALDKTKTAVKETAQTIIDGTQNLAQKTGSAIDNAYQDSWLERRVQDTQELGQKTGDAIEKAYDGSWLETGVQKVAGVFTGTEQTEQTAEQPAEQVAATQPRAEQAQPEASQPAQEAGFIDTVGDTLQTAAQKTGDAIDSAYQGSWLQSGVNSVTGLFTHDEKPADAETKLAQLQEENKALHAENMKLKLEIARLKAEQQKDQAIETAGRHETYKLTDAYDTDTQTTITVKGGLLSTLEKNKKEAPKPAPKVVKDVSRS